MTVKEDRSGALTYLSSSLQGARKRAGLTQQSVAASLHWSVSKVRRIEQGEVSLQVTDLLALLGLYGVSDADMVAKLTDAAQVTQKRPRQWKFPNVIDSAFALFLNYEDTASTIMTFQTLAIPGLLQTKEYTEALLRANGASHADERLELRRVRQLLLSRPDAPELVCVIDEAALHRQVGGPVVMRDQLARLLAEGERDKSSVEVIPYSAGAYPSMIESFTLLHSQRWAQDVLFREGPGQAVTENEDHDLIAAYKARLSVLREMSLKGAEARSLISSVIGELRNARSAQHPWRPGQRD